MGDSDWQEVTRKKRRSVFERLGYQSKGRTMSREIRVNTISIYVSNFPSHLMIHKLWNIYGKNESIIDVYIAKHKNKLGKMFAFCRFKGIDNCENLINSLKEVWIGKLRLNANIARFDRKEGNKPLKADVKRQDSCILKPLDRVSINSHSFINVVGGHSSGVKKENKDVHLDESPSMILSQEDNSGLSLALIGCHKDFYSISNSKIVCKNEGFAGVDIKYLGGLWVLFEFNDKNVRDNFLKHEGTLSWFSSLKPWHDDFMVKDRLIWLEVEGVPLLAWNNETFKKICSNWGEVLFIDDTDSSNRFSIRLLDDESDDEEGSVGRHRNEVRDNEDVHEVESVGNLLVNDYKEGQHNRDEERKDAEDDNDPFELASLIAKNEDYHKHNMGTSTPKYLS
nr:reverse transcriptase domain, reverse transcriptase zinc-binding domain protein [Tanacetum cinerariifolium]